MAFGAETAGAGALAYTIYVRPSRDLVDRSWQWPESRHRAFERMRAELALAAATCILEGLPVTAFSIAQQLTLDGVEIEVEVDRKGARIVITVVAFSPQGGPDAPGPNGGCEQPRPADGLALGLRGSGRVFHIVVFDGYMPSVPGPARNLLSLGSFEAPILNRIDSLDAIPATTTHSNAICSMRICLDHLIQYLLTRPSEGLQATLVDRRAAESNRREVNDPAAQVGPALSPTPHREAFRPINIHQLQPGNVVAPSECDEPGPCRYPTSGGVSDAPSLDELQASAWSRRLQAPLCDLSAGHYLQ